MTELLTVGEVRDKLPASNRPSERTLREQLLAAGCAVKIGRRVYTSSVMWDRFLCQTARSVRTSSHTDVAMSGTPATAPATKPKAAPRPAQVARFITEDALDKVRGVAPGWDRQWLLARYREWTAGKPEPENLDAAFLGWVKRFTKGKVP